MPSLLIVLSMLILCACAPTLHSTRSVVDIPEQFSTSGEDTLLDRWWTAFADQQLNTFIDLALADNLGLRATWERLRQADSVARKAGAERSPTFNVEGGASRTKNKVNSVTNFSLGLNASYEIDLWGMVAANIAAADLDFQASAADLQTSALTLTSQVATTWYQLVEKQGQYRLMQTQLEANLQVEELVRVQVRTGRVGVADLLQQQQLIESVSGDLKLVTAGIEQLEHRLAILCGQPPNHLFDSLSQPLASTISSALTELPQLSLMPPLPPRPVTGLPVALIQRRPDLRAAFAAVQAADQRVGAAISDRFPRFSLSARLSVSSESTGDLFDNWLTTLAANLIGPVIDGGKRRAEVDRTRAVARAAFFNYGQAALNALGEVEDALSNEVYQQQYSDSLGRQLEYSTSVLSNLRDRYTRGATDYLRVLTALLARQRLERNLLQAQRDLLINRITLYSALSGGWELDTPTQIN